MLRAGCTWRLLPDSFPPWRTVYRWFVRLRDGGVFEAIIPDPIERNLRPAQRAEAATAARRLCGEAKRADARAGV